MLAKAAYVLLCSSMLVVAQPGTASDPNPATMPSRGGDDLAAQQPIPRIPPNSPPRFPDGRRPLVDEQIKRVTVAQKPRFESLASEDLRDLKISVSESGTLADVVQAIGAAARVTARADWARLGAEKVQDRPIGAPLQGVRVEDALRILHSRGLTGPEPLAARRTGEIIEVSSLRVFDLRETTTRAYDIRALLPADPMQRDFRLRNVVDVIMTTIEPEGWTQNGGDTSRLSELDGRLFVVAPPRVHAGVSWVLAQVGGGEVEDAGR